MNATTALVGEAEPAAFDQADLDALRDSISSVLSEQCGSLAVHAFLDGKSDLDRRLWQQAAELGWFGIALPEQYGGLGMGALALSVLHSELGRYTAPGSFIATLSAAQALVETASDDVKTIWLPRFAAGEISAAVPVSIGEGTALGRIVLLGSEDADIALVPAAEGRWAMIDLAGAQVERAAFWDLTRAVIEIDVKGLPLLATLPAATGTALENAMALAVAADSIGGARAIAEQTVDYLKNRQQFGRAIASFQAIKHRAVDLVALVTTNDHVVAQAADMAIRGDVDAALWAALAKAEAADAFVFIAADCVQLHGGVGFTWEYDCHIFLKRARFNEMLIAPNPQMRDRASAGLAASVRAGRTTLELPTS
ncbi:MAG: acyl-CoA dehydrogenase family protein [Sphingobium sp.]